MPVFITGTTQLSYTQQFLRQDPTKYAVGAQLTSYLPGTTTPLTAYRDPSAQLPHPNPITLGSDGRIPAMYFITAIDDVPQPYTSVRLRLVDAAGVLQWDFPDVLLYGVPGTGGGGGPAPSPVDPNAISLTGDMMARYGIGVRPGWVRANGLTIGSLTSGATELASASCSALFQYLWNTDPNLVVVGGRGPSAAADWNEGGASKQLTLPDWSGRAMAFLDNMSGTARGVLSTAVFTGLPPTTLGAQAGTERHQLAINEIPVHDHAAFVDEPSHSHEVRFSTGQAQGGSGQFLVASITIAAASIYNTAAKLIGLAVKSVAGGAIDNKTAAIGGGQVHLNTQPTKLATLYIRL